MRILRSGSVSGSCVNQELEGHWEGERMYRTCPLIPEGAKATWTVNWHNSRTRTRLGGAKPWNRGKRRLESVP